MVGPQSGVTIIPVSTRIMTTFVSWNWLMDVYPLNKCSLGLRMAICGYETPTAVNVRQPHSFTGPSRFLTPIQIHPTQVDRL